VFFLLQTSSVKTKVMNKAPEAKRLKPKTSVSRRSSIRSQNQNPSTPKPEYVHENTKIQKRQRKSFVIIHLLNYVHFREPVSSPSTPSSSRTNDSALSKCKKSLVLSQQRLASQKYSSAFLKPISNKTVSGYEDLIYR